MMKKINFEKKKKNINSEMIFSFDSGIISSPLLLYSWLSPFYIYYPYWETTWIKFKDWTVQFSPMSSNSSIDWFSRFNFFQRRSIISLMRDGSKSVFLGIAIDFMLKFWGFDIIFKKSLNISKSSTSIKLCILGSRIPYF